MTDNWQNRLANTIELVEAHQLLANPKNPRRHPGRQREALIGSLDTLGFVAPVLVSKQSGYMLDGHARVEEALTKDENSLIPVLYVDIEPHEEDIFLASFDWITTLADYDADVLDSLLREVQTDDTRLQQMFSEQAESFDLYFGDEPTIPEDAGAQIDRAEELNEKWQVKLGDLFEIKSLTGNGVHRLLCGDSTNADDVSRLMGGEKAQLIVTSPPYNQNLETFKPSGMQKESPSFVNRMANSYYDSIDEDEYQCQQVEMINLLGHWLNDNGSIFYNHKIRYRNKTILSPYEWLSKCKYPIRQEIIWDRGSSITQNARMFTPCDERIYWLRVGDDFIFNDTTEIKSYSSVWRFGAHNEISISAPFANELPYRCIIACTKDDDIVIEPYGGSGTTMAVSEQLQRQCRMIEIEPKYCAVILQRMLDMGCEPRKLDAHEKSPT